MYSVNQKTLAAALGISDRQVRNLRDQGMFEFISGTKKYDLTKCVSEYIEFKVKAETGRGTSIVIEKEKAEHEHFKKELTKLKLRKARGEVHEAADIEDFLCGMLLSFRNHLLSVPQKIAPQILNEADIHVIIKTIETELLSTLDELSEYDPVAINKNSVGILDEDDEDDEDENGEAE